MDENIRASERQEEFDQLYLKYKAQLMQLVMLSIHDRDLAEDVVQEVFYEACRKGEVFDNHPNKVAWLHKVAGYKVKELLRKLAPSDECSIEAEGMEISNEDEGYAKSEMNLMLYEMLTEDELLRFRRYFIWGEEPEEIAEKENISANYMRVKLSRLKKKIEKIVSKK